MLLQGFFLGHNAFAYLFNNPAMIFRELTDLLIIDEVSEAITCISNIDSVVFEDGSYACCTHTIFPCCVLILIGLVDEFVGLLNCVPERGGYIICAVILVVGVSNDLNRHLTGAFATCVSAHTIRYYKQGTFLTHHRCILGEYRQHIIFILSAFATNICNLSDMQLEGAV